MRFRRCSIALGRAGRALESPPTDSANPSRGWWLVLLLLTGATFAQPPSYRAPGTPEVGGINDLVLIYHGGKNRVSWTKDALLPYVAYVDELGQPVDWLFDSFLFIEFATDDGTWLHARRPGGRLPNLDDWQWLAESWFREQTGLTGLEQAVAAVGAELGQPDHKVKVVITLPNPLREIRAFGPLPGENETLDFDRLADRQRAVQWYIGRVLEQWRARQFPHLELTGFYWTSESISGVDEALVRATSEYLRGQGLKHYWIPYYGAQGLRQWQGLGFAGVMLQPNYFFPPERLPLQRFQTAAKLARAAGSGIEIEFDGRALLDPEYRDRMVAYLDAGVAYGWMNGALLGYYEGGDGVAKLARDPGTGRELYRKLYQFVKGTYQSSGKFDFASLPLVVRDNSGDLALASKGAKVIGAPGRPEWGAGIGPEQLIDGNLDFYGGMDGFGAFYIPGGFIIELPQVATVARTQTMLFDLDLRFFRYRIDTSVDLNRWEPAVDKDTGQWRGWQVDRFAPRQAKYVRFTGLYNSANEICQVVEFEVYGE